MPLDIPNPLIEAIKDGKATLFLGAGASMEAGFPGTREIANYLAKEAGTDLETKLKDRNLDVIADYLYQKEGYGENWVKEKLISFYKKNMEQIKNPPSEAHYLISKIKWRKIYTTNYDTIIERTYLGSNEKVQHLLPVTDYNIELERNKEDTLQYIKLNGCILEADKKADHKLVITFADQQRSRIDKDKLYGFLQKDSLIGPIVFIGFSFTHPGSQKGTSPEYEILQQILREIGPSTGFHYSVTPFDVTSFEDEILVKKLSSNNVICINSKFGPFIKEIVQKIRTPTSLKEKPSIPIQVGKAQIEINSEDHAKDKEFFNVIGPHLWHKLPPPVEKSLNGHEDWSSFYYNHFIKRICHNDFISKLQIPNKSQEIFLFSADIGWGKTSFLKQVSVDLSSSGRPIIWLRPDSSLLSIQDEHKTFLGSWDYTRIDRLIGQINTKIKDTKQSFEEYTPLIIADNVPDRIEEVLNLFKHLNLRERRYGIIITLRKNEYESAIIEYPMLKKATYYEPDVSKNVTEITKLLDHCEKHRIGLIDNKLHKEEIQNTITESKADEALILALQIIFDKQHRPFNKIISEIYNELDNKTQQMILYISCLNKHGGEFYPRLYSLLHCFPATEHFNTMSLYNKCLEKDILFEETHNEEPCVRTLHPLVAQEFAKVSGLDNFEIDTILTSLLSNMTKNNIRDLNIIRSLLKQINDYTITISSEQIIEKIFDITTENTDNDWVVSQQYSKYLLNREEYERSYYWIEQALLKNPQHTTLLHHKGNVLRRWGMKLRKEGNINESNIKFNEAKILFSKSRIGTEPNEYGYVTHLDMLLYLIDNSQSVEEASGNYAEGFEIFKNGMRNIPVDKYNLLLDDRFKRFIIDQNLLKQIVSNIEKALDSGKSSSYAACFLSDYYYYQENNQNKAIDILHKYREYNDKGILTWLKETRYLADKGEYSEALKTLHSAKLREHSAEDAETLWYLIYLDLVLSIINENYKDAKNAVIRLIEGKFYPRTTLPRGYIWKESSRNVPLKKRKLSEHAMIFTGRILDVRSSGNYGQILLENISGEQFFVDFFPQSFGRSVNKHDFIKFTIQLFNWGVRAENLNATPYMRSYDHFYVDENKKPKTLSDIRKNALDKIEKGGKISRSESQLLFGQKVNWKNKNN